MRFLSTIHTQVDRITRWLICSRLLFGEESISLRAILPLEHIFARCVSAKHGWWGARKMKCRPGHHPPLSVMPEVSVLTPMLGCLMAAIPSFGSDDSREARAALAQYLAGKVGM